MKKRLVALYKYVHKQLSLFETIVKCGEQNYDAGESNGSYSSVHCMPLCLTQLRLLCRSNLINHCCGCCTACRILERWWGTWKLVYFCFNFCYARSNWLIVYQCLLLTRNKQHQKWRRLTLNLYHFIRFCHHFPFCCRRVVLIHFIFDNLYLLRRIYNFSGEYIIWFCMSLLCIIFLNYIFSFLFTLAFTIAPRSGNQRCRADDFLLYLIHFAVRNGNWMISLNEF